MLKTIRSTLTLLMLIIIHIQLAGSECSVLEEDTKSKAALAEKSLHNIQQILATRIRSLIPIARTSKGVPIVAIAGCSAVGKSYFSYKLCDVLKKVDINATVLHLDDFMQPGGVERPLLHPNLQIPRTIVHRFSTMWSC